MQIPSEVTFSFMITAFTGLGQQLDFLVSKYHDCISKVYARYYSIEFLLECWSSLDDSTRFHKQDTWHSHVGK